MCTETLQPAGTFFLGVTWIVNEEPGDTLSGMSTEHHPRSFTAADATTEKNNTTTEVSSLIVSQLYRKSPVLTNTQTSNPERQIIPRSSVAEMRGWVRDVSASR